MEILAQHPITEAQLNPYVGRPVGAVLPDGDMVFGTFDRIHEGHVVFRPATGLSTSSIQRMKQNLKSNPTIQSALQKAKTRAWGHGVYGGYPYGWGYGNFGWGIGWWWILPLFFLAALVALPFFW